MMAARFQGMLFDMDGTLTEPSHDFALLRDALGIEAGVDIVKAIEGMDEAGRKRSWRIIEDYEEQVRADTRIKPGARDALVNFRDAGLKLGLLTRNSFKSVEAVMAVLQFDFDSIITREFPHVKPSPEPALHMLRGWGMKPDKALLVGDYKFDIECGLAAGTATCCFENEGLESFAHMSDYCIKSFAELESIVFLKD